MNVRLTFRILGGLLIFLGLALLAPLPVAVMARPPGGVHDGGLWALLAAAVLTFTVGGALYFGLKTRGDISHREGFGIVTLGWLAFALFGALPYVLSGVTPRPVDAFFESMSGFTTTGATVLADLSAVPPSILLWRALTQWLGGMGIIVLSLAILPFLGVSGMQLYEAEVPGPTADRLSPRIQDTAKVLWGVYALLTLAQWGLLCLGGMSVFEACCHALTTMSSGGFSTRNASVGAFSAYIQWVIIVFMFLAGMNFTLHYYLLRGRFKHLWGSEEFRWYLAIATAAGLAIFALNAWAPAGTEGRGLRAALFQAVSIMTTTGYVTTDYQQWPPMAQYILLTLMFIGGCAGSTAGGMKVVRIGMMTRQGHLQISQLIHPREVRVLKLDHKPVLREVMQGISGFLALYCGVLILSALLLAGIGLDRMTAGAAAIACLGNIGPAFGAVGPVDTFAQVPGAGKLILCVCMLIGRLELFTVLVLFFPSFWRK